MADSPPQLAGLRRRLASLLYEALLLAGVSAALLVPLWLYSALANHAVPIPLYRVYFFLSFALYFLWHWHSGRQTLAMQTWRLRIVCAGDSGQPTLLRLAVRYVLAWPSIGLGGIGLLWALFDRHSQFLHDRLAGTHIIFVPPTTASNSPPAGT
jgi:uncharacterized RDD family membrane protein YckC